jgi:hypothetical protein
MFVVINLTQWKEAKQMKSNSKEVKREKKERKKEGERER